MDAEAIQVLDSRLGGAEATFAVLGREAEAAGTSAEAVVVDRADLAGEELCVRSSSPPRPPRHSVAGGGGTA